jgi:dienelactone hydrolase
MLRQLALLCGLSLAVAATLSAQPQSGAELPRRGWFGVALGPHDSGAVVTSVVDGSSAAVAGIRAGDVIRAVDDRPTLTPNDVIAAIGRHVGGDVAAIEVVRDGHAERKSIVLRSLPRETLAGATFEYGSVTLPDASRLRTIVSVPDRRQGPLAAVMFVQGGGCGSLDVPLAPDVAQPGLIRTIAAQGYVTMRVEKSGVGDSKGPPCDTIGYVQELDGYRTALTALKRHPAVDANHVYVLGNSLGGVFAPILAGETPVRGIAVFGTLAASPPPYPGRSDRFFREFAAIDVAAAWSAVEGRVIVLHGEFDELTAAADHARIAALVNARHPGRATHLELPGLDHCATWHETLADSRRGCGTGQPVSTLSDAVLAFLAGPGP